MIQQAPLTTEERNWAMAAHLSALIAIIGFPFGHIVGPLVVHLVKGGESPFVNSHSKASLNYQLTVSIGAILAIVIAVVLFVLIVGAGAFAESADKGAGSAAAGVGIFGLWMAIIAIVVAVTIGSLIFIILGTVAASDGRPYTYPFAIRFLR